MPPVARITATSRCLHQLLRAFERDRRHPVDGAVGRARGPRGLVHHLGHARDARDGGGVRAEHDGTARLERDQDLVDGGRGRVRGRDDGGDDAERLGDLDDLPLLVAADDADGRHRADERGRPAPRRRGSSGSCRRRRRSRFPRRRGGRTASAAGGGRGRHRVDDGVDALLGELGQRRARGFRARGRASAPRARMPGRDRAGLVARPWRQATSRASAGCARPRRAGAG